MPVLSCSDLTQGLHLFSSSQRAMLESEQAVATAEISGAGPL